MKILLFAVALSIGIGLPLTSGAKVSAFGIEVPIERTRVSENIISGYVPKNPGDTFRVQKLQNPGLAASTQEVLEKDIYYVFGIKIAVYRKS